MLSLRLQQFFSLAHGGAPDTPLSGTIGARTAQEAAPAAEVKHDGHGAQAVAPDAAERPAAQRAHCPGDANVAVPAVPVRHTDGQIAQVVAQPARTISPARPLRLQ